MEQRELAVKHSKKALQLRPNAVDYLLSALFCIASLKNTQARNRSERPKDVPETAAVARNVLAMEGLEPPTIASAYYVLVVSSTSVLDKVKWASKSIEINPFGQAFYYARAFFYESLKDNQKAATDRAKADALKKAHTLFVSSRLEKDPAEAVRLAQEACQLTNYSYYKHLSALAFAHHKNGDHAEAVRWSEKSWKLLESWPDGETKSSIAKSLVDYRKRVARK